MSATPTTGEAPVGQTRPARRKPWYYRLGPQIFVGIALGIALGFIAPKAAIPMKVLGDIFLNLIKTIVAPLVFLNVVLGIAAAGDLKSVGRIGLRALLYFEIVSTIILVIAMVIANVSGVGADLHLVPDAAEAAAGSAKYAKSGTTFSQFLLSMFPHSFFGAFAEGALLQILVIAVLFGAAVLALKPEQRKGVESALHGMSDCFFKLTDMIMKLAPIGAFGSIAFAIGNSGMSAILSLGYLLLVMYASLALMIVVVMGVIMRLYGFNIFLFLRYFKDEIVLLFATASSESALPSLIDKLQKLGCSRQSVGLVLPTGYAFNLDGTAVYMSLCVLFLANAYGINLTFEHQLGIIALMMITSKGAATVSGGTFIVFAATVTAAGVLPVEGLPLLLGINRLTSQAVCICNAMGNAVATMVVSKVCGEFDPAPMRSEYARVLGRPANAAI
ncbi:cation:dicarboxylate symporter family transporter [Herbaspirillum robiniae]|uniref:Cation:dicarboxylase symporter family transporter n=1 Tax=Herbaspirillum robiniae TaxID=2014887 RepID=A0A246WLH8_9BURK|nr:cation:dicarboxylase symporter family transporter [Herbaspirillum robiniae]NUU02792.1 cation:dicarboxylase symporter family transporter [Herbaspirillum robiniae]OWY27097.1 dicarboxylate/amino acid:cation symporter [Herbaspirillum robiniae]